MSPAPFFKVDQIYRGLDCLHYLEDFLEEIETLMPDFCEIINLQDHNIMGGGQPPRQAYTWFGVNLKLDNVLFSGCGKNGNIDDLLLGVIIYSKEIVGIVAT